MSPAGACRPGFLLGMSMTEKLKTAPVEEPLTLAEAKSQGIIETSAYDTHATRLIKTARQWVEDYLGRAIMQQTWLTYLDRFPKLPSTRSRVIRLNHAPLVSVTSITYVDTDGSSQTLASAAYNVDVASEPGRIAEAFGYIWPDTYDQLNAVTIESVHGYSGTGDSPVDRSNIPEPIRQAIAIIFTELYQHRAMTVLGLSKATIDAAASLLFRYRVQPIDYS